MPFVPNLADIRMRKMKNVEISWITSLSCQKQSSIKTPNLWPGEFLYSE